jgi:hypothetical protein
MTTTDQDIIEGLKRELEMTRFVVVGSAPDEFHSLLFGRDHQFNEESDLWHWRRDVFAAVIDAAQPDQHGRAACPLCRSRGNSQSWGNDGWAVGGGLWMHLDGTGHAEKCPVFEIAFKLLQDRHRETFIAADQAKSAAHAARLKTDPVILIDPNSEPVLMAESPWANETPRSPDAWTTVDGRLREIGFEIEKTGNVTAYKYMINENLMVLADPRKAGTVEFAVFQRSGKHRWKYAPATARIKSLHDAWRDWPAAFRKRLPAIPGIVP